MQLFQEIIKKKTNFNYYNLCVKFEKIKNKKRKLIFITCMPCLNLEQHQCIL